jgi:hypothetical protein
MTIAPFNSDARVGTRGPRAPIAAAALDLDRIGWA